MSLTATYKKITFQFRFPAGTSRGVLTKKDSWFLIIEKNGIQGIGECSPVPGLSIDSLLSYGQKLEEACRQINNGIPFNNINPLEYPSIRFGIEIALKDFENSGNRILFPGDFTEGLRPIPVNGLVWMGEKEYME